MANTAVWFEIPINDLNLLRFLATPRVIKLAYIDELRK